MAYPFSVARAAVMSNNDVICGKVDNEGFIESNDGHFFKIKPPVSFNTCLFDYNGDEIFTNDILRCIDPKPMPKFDYEVEYCIDEGALCVKHIEQKTLYRRPAAEYHKNLSRVNRTDVILDPLTQESASHYAIVGNIYTGVIIPRPNEEVSDDDD